MNIRPGIRRAVCVIGVLAAWLGVVAPALAAQRYATPTGTGTACTSAAPCPLTTAINSASAGDEVLVGPGSYGTSSAPITTAINVNAGDVDIHGVDASPGAPGATIYTSEAYGIQLYGPPGDVISDLTIDDVGSSGGAALDLTGESADRMTLIGGPNAGSACLLAGTALLTNSVCRASSPSGNGVWLYGPLSGAANATIRNVDAIATGSSGSGISDFSDNSAGDTTTLHAYNTIARGPLTDINTSEANGTSPLEPATVYTSHSNYSLAHSGQGSGGVITDDGTSQTSNVQTPAQLFVNPSTGDFQELLGAETVGAGSPAGSAGSFDSLGYARQFDAGGGCASTDIGADEFAPSAAPTITGLAATVGGDSTAQLSAGADPLGGPGSYHFDYAPAGPGGAAPSTFSSTPEGCLAVADSTEPASAALSGLTPGTTYYYRLVASDGDGTTMPAFTATFTTAPAPVTTPTATTPTPTPVVTTPTAAATQSATASVGNQRLTLISPSARTCLAPGATLAAQATSTAISGSRGAKLTVASASFFLDKGVKHTIRTTVRSHGKDRTVVVVSYAANVTTRRLPATVKLSLKGLKAGAHTVAVTVRYRETVVKRGHRTTTTVSRTLKARFLVC